MNSWNTEKQWLDWEVSTLGAKGAGAATEEKVSESPRLRYTWAIISSLHSFPGSDIKEESHLGWKNCSLKELKWSSHFSGSNWRMEWLSKFKIKKRMISLWDFTRSRNSVNVSTQQAPFPAQRGDQGASLLLAMELGAQRCAQGFYHLDWGKNA